MIPMQQGQPFIPPGSQQFRPVGQVMPAPNVGTHAVQSQQLQYSQPLQHLPLWPSQPGAAMPSSQAVAMPYGQPNRPLTSSSPQAQPTAPHLGAPGIPHSSSYGYAPSNFGQPQNNANTLSQFQPMSQGHAPVVSVGGQPWLSSGSHGASTVVPVQHAGQQPSVSSSSDPAINIPNFSQQSSSDWQEHTAADGRRYYYNKKTKQSSWEKPFELMSPVERADASTVWKEFTTPEGKKYYYNKVTKQSKWSIPDELKFAREQAQQTVIQATQSVTNVNSEVPTTVSVTSDEVSNSAISVASVLSVPLTGVASSPISVTPVVSVADSAPTVASGSAAIATADSALTSAASVQLPAVTRNALPTSVSGGTGVPSASANANTSLSGFDNQALQRDGSSWDGASIRDIEDARKGSGDAGKANLASLEEKDSDDEPLVFANKQEAKIAFKALLESANVRSDWTWEQTMREVINDKRYGALKTIGERKQAFNEYLGQRKKIEAEERRMRQKKAREEFSKMLEESTELTSSMKWSKAVSLFENDERFKSVEKARDREDLFDNYVVELERKEKEKAAEDHKQHVAEYRKFLESCDFIKVNSQWRKIQDRLEDDERCLHLEKLDRLLVYQDYIRDLEREEEEQKKIHKEKLRRAERKNRDAFRKLMAEHVAAGSLTAKTHWHDYCLKVKESDQYHAVATNTSGSTPKDLFENVAEELEKQFPMIVARYRYHDDKTRVKDVMKSGKITMLSTWTFEEFKAATSVEVGSPPISDINLKLLYKELVERSKEKEEKEAKKHQRLADDFTKLLHTCKEITATSDWEDSKSLVEESQEYRAIGEECLRREIFEEYIAYLQEKAKEKERKREEEKAKKDSERDEKEKRRDKERKEKEKERDKEKGKERTKKDETDSDNMDETESYKHRDEKKREKEKDRKHRKRHQTATDDVSSDKDEKEDSKKSRRHGSERKKSKKHSYTPESDNDNRHKRHRRDHRGGSRRNGGYEELEDGELGVDGEIQ